MNTKNLKPFDLQAALKGEPVMLGDGTKAYVRHHETELRTLNRERLLGYAEGDAIDVLMSWGKDGIHAMSRYDIVGMWPKTRVINGIEVPAPESKEPNEGVMYFSPNICCAELYVVNRWDGYSYDLLMLERGLVFLSKEGPIANAKAMLGINPYDEESEE